MALEEITSNCSTTNKNENIGCENMETMYAMQPRKRYGFSLIEMLVALGIVSALTALAAPIISGAREKARNSVCDGMYKPVITELTNSLNNKLEDGTGDADSIVQDFLDKNRFERNPRSKKQKAYVLYNPSAVNSRPPSCQVAIYPKGTDIILVGQEAEMNSGYRTTRIQID